jgi:putative transposase
MHYGGRLPWPYFHLDRFRRSEISEKGWDRLRALNVWQQTKDVELVCQTFAISRATVYRWIKKFNPEDLRSLNEKSRRPKKLRKPLWSVELVTAVKKLREEYPRWGKEKLVVLLQKKGFKTCASTIGRVLGYLKNRGALIEPKRNYVSAHRRPTRRPYAIRKPKDFVIKKPGDLVQLDTLDLRPVPDVVVKQFTARDYVSRCDVIEVHNRATVKTATSFLNTLQARMPFPVKSIQIDGGSEFFSDFEAECQRRGILLFVLPPKSPKLNGRVERANRTHTEEFYEVSPCRWTLSHLNEQLLVWEKTYNSIRPHQALGYLTPAEFLQQIKDKL